MIVWMTFDPETERIALLDSEPGDGNFPRGKRGRGWEVRQSVMDEGVWADLMASRLAPDEQDDLHQRLWMEAAR